MLFSSFLFLFWFLPTALLLYFAVPALATRIFRLKRHTALGLQNAILFAVSLFFYAWGEPVYLLLMLLTAALNFLCSLWTVRSRYPRLPLTLAVVFDLGILFYFKYAAFFLRPLGLTVGATRLPLGISFYTFQALSYVADVYWGRVEPTRRFLTFGTYLALFPQLIAGPIVRYSDVEEALASREHSIPSAARGTRHFIAGLAKKVLLANPWGALFATLTEHVPLSFTAAWLALLAFAFQIYFDFSGYSDMAVGLGEILGFHFPQNFNYPYISVSVTDFWRRWHITLSSFFKEYVYIPLGGSRKGTLRTVLNLLAVWLLTGLWHGAAWNFILWGLYYFVLLMIEKFILRDALEKLPLWGRRALTSVAVLLGWLLFALDGSTPALAFSSIGSFLFALVGGKGLAAQNDLYHLVRHLPFLAISVLAATPLPRKFWKSACQGRAALTVLFPLLGLLLSVCYLADASFNPFLYFRF
ncbi:MAG: MBOAT family protein [Clostridia bacterium]|nr:MBOAT family protein [Clostridia bacterium]